MRAPTFDRRSFNKRGPEGRGGGIPPNVSSPPPGKKKKGKRKGKSTSYTSLSKGGTLTTLLPSYNAFSVGEKKGRRREIYFHSIVNYGKEEKKEKKNKHPPPLLPSSPSRTQIEKASGLSFFFERKKK